MALAICRGGSPGTDSWEWNGQTGTGHQAQEYKVKKGQEHTAIHQEKPGFKSGARGGRLRQATQGIGNPRSEEWEWTL